MGFFLHRLRLARLVQFTPALLLALEVDGLLLQPRTIGDDPRVNPRDARFQFLLFSLGEFGFEFAQFGVVTGGAGFLMKGITLTEDGVYPIAVNLNFFVQAGDVAEIGIHAVHQLVNTHERLTSFGIALTLVPIDFECMEIRMNKSWATKAAA